MSPTVFEITSPVPLFNNLPLQIRQKTSRSAVLLMVLLLIPAIAAVLVPVGLVAAHAAVAPDTFTVLMTKPVSALQLSLGLLLWVALFAWPLKTLLSRLGNERHIRIEKDRVQVEERQLFRNSQWSQPLSGFRGVAHNVRATLSGTRHELILVHPERKRSLLLHTAEVMPQSVIDSACKLFALPQLSARELYFTLELPGKQAPAAPERVHDRHQVTAAAA